MPAPNARFTMILRVYNLRVAVISERWKPAEWIIMISNAYSSCRRLAIGMASMIVAAMMLSLSLVSVTAANEDNNLYFGDTHVHTALSFDSYLSSNRVGMGGAYRFAKGEPVELFTGEVRQLARPLDFVALTDHAESFGLFITCGRADISPRQRDYCQQFETGSRAVFMKLRNEASVRPPIRSVDLCGEDAATCMEDARATWRAIREAADEFNIPGEFTAFAAYEYSPVLPKRGKIHRNVIFKNSVVPEQAVSAFDAATVLDLWRSLEAECTGDCEFLTIPHNMNKTWGIAYSGKTIDGDPYDRDDWALRGRSEPLAEIFQIKGSSECGFGLGASDEECNFELIVPLCEGKQEPGCSGRTSFAREGLKIGMQLEQQLGVNPLRIGFVGSTDTHLSNPGDTLESISPISSKTQQALAKGRLGSKGDKAWQNPGGLAAIWARENTRAAIFEAMERRETYGTSGPRIKLRFFGGWEFDQAMLNDSDLIRKAYDGGVPMGGVLENAAPDAAPKFLVWAAQDSAGGKLQRVQMIKAWLEDGESKERVVDIACSDGLQPDSTSGRCPDNGARVDVANCAVTADKGASEIKIVWADADFDATQSALYYIRVIENPSCRWSTYDALRLGIEPPADLSATIQERAWSSPIWYAPGL